MVRLISYLASCAVVAAVLWWLASARADWVLPSAWLVAWIVGLMVTASVARREGRRPLPWVLAALVIGPVAWVALSAAAGASRGGETGHDLTGDGGTVRR